MSETEKTVYVVHCIDSEGPLSESLSDTFQRIKQIYGVDLTASYENLRKLQDGEIDLGAKTAAIRKMVDPKLLLTNASWDDIGRVLDVITSPAFRMQHQDSFGNGWLYNWFCLDHVGYTENPRNRDIGDHRIYDHYATVGQKLGNGKDRIYFHYHPLPYNRKAHSCATFYLNENHIYEILAKKIIDRQWFPSVFRPGFHTTRPDSNWFLEQWIPFDYANQATDAAIDQPDLSNGRFGDWRQAPKIWGGYHPSHDDYQTVGSCRRWIFRCLNMEARLRQLTPTDIDDACRQADALGSAVLAFTDHDFRNMAPEISNIYSMIRNVFSKWPHVNFKYCNALEAARNYIGMKDVTALDLRVSFVKNVKRNANELIMTASTQGDIFGPQPFFAVKDSHGRYYYDNLDRTLKRNEWNYFFDWQTFPPDSIDSIGLAVTGMQGQVEIIVHNVRSNDTVLRKLHYKS